MLDDFATETVTSQNAEGSWFATHWRFPLLIVVDHINIHENKWVTVTLSITEQRSWAVLFSFSHLILCMGFLCTMLSKMCTLWNDRTDTNFCGAGSSSRRVCWFWSWGWKYRRLLFPSMCDLLAIEHRPKCVDLPMFLTTPWWSFSSFFCSGCLQCTVELPQAALNKPAQVADAAEILYCTASQAFFYSCSLCPELHSTTLPALTIVSLAYGDKPVKHS